MSRFEKYEALARKDALTAMKNGDDTCFVNAKYRACEKYGWGLKSIAIEIYQTTYLRTILDK